MIILLVLWWRRVTGSRRSTVSASGQNRLCGVCAGFGCNFCSGPGFHV